MSPYGITVTNEFSLFFGAGVGVGFQAPGFLLRKGKERIGLGK
jgi:hypothetical protein